MMSTHHARPARRRGQAADQIRQSRPIEANGRFIGVAVATGSHWHVVPVDPAVAGATGAYASEAEAASAARQALFTRPKRIL